MLMRAAMPSAGACTCGQTPASPLPRAQLIAFPCRYAQVSVGATIRRTRWIERNRHPVWQQRLLFPLAGLKAKLATVRVELFDRDLTGRETLGGVRDLAPAAGLAAGCPASADANQPSGPG